MGHKDGEVIQHSMVTKSLERAQKKVEENNFGIRKRLLEYDDVMNIQREAIYKKRNNALSGNRIAVDINNMFSALAENIVMDHRHAGNHDSFKNEVMTSLGFEPSVDAATFSEGNEEDIVDQLKSELQEFYSRKGEKISELLFPVIKNVYENEGHRYKRIAVPFTDGRSNPLPVSANLEETVKSNGQTLMREIEMAVTLALIDENWKEHLRSMDELKESSQAASFEQKDPLVIYKMEAYELFENVVYNINKDVASYLMKGRILLGNNKEMSEAREQKTDLSKVRTSRAEQAARAAAEGAGRGQAKPETFVRTEKKVGRNDPCPCGSGKKFKQCHGKA